MSAIADFRIIQVSKLTELNSHAEPQVKKTLFGKKLIDKFLKSLSVDAFNLGELIEFNKEFSEDDDPDLAKAELDGIRALRDSLSQLVNDQSVVLLSIH